MRSFHGSSLAYAVLALIGMCLGAQESLGAKPNVIIFYTDDQGYGDRQKYNPTLVSTPNLETLSANGIEFSDGHSGAAVCTPARFALLTGTYSFRQRPNGGAIGAAATPMIPGHYTLANLFKDAGYRTLMSGKWHLGMDMPSDLENGNITGGPVDAGFEEFFGIPASMNYGYLSYIRNRTFTEAPNMHTAKAKHSSDAIQSCPSKDKTCRTYNLKFPYSEKHGSITVAPSYRAHYCLSNMTKEAINMIENHVANYPSQKFFLYLAVTAPHLPHTPHPDFVGRTTYGAYTDYLEEIDYRLGEIMTTLKNLGIYNSTLIVFTSDNGTEGAGKFEKTGFDTTYIYRGQKRTLYEGGHRVPFVMHWPDQIKPNSTWDEPVSQLDLLATFAAMTGTSIPDTAGPDSFSLWSVLEDIDTAASQNVRENQPIIIEDAHARLTARCKEYKWLATAKHGIYNLAESPTESRYDKTKPAERYREALYNAAKAISKSGHSSETAICGGFTE
mmetsp:Transcript_21053/g.41298  ORF Transcript_21053/g.41298 Transcript_21053/m.41298 type:complete len:500 (+) Transcript_21053:100-1599(+)|eukprot:CAMPEP_0171486970 /NCGR_PEP_ID=MMETSP0958-20121227/1378_1 /TAXON_ID=87120 /ORGANISM="Aurantiochytrium limacinum, Strain ATCCMYA-1381" /LENGTH=499 /DNA_ID=CAMNT_0012019893 /DNA_START=17 /DNA_END=1516 /DNA_ORIENTATION=+